MSAAPIDDLASARTAFDTWRASKRYPGRVPSHLWAMATALVGRYPLETVALETGLKPDRLRARLLQAAPSSSAPFVELRPFGVADVRPSRRDRSSAATSPDAPVQISVHRTDGACLELALPLAERELLERLWCAFLSSHA